MASALAPEQVLAREPDGFGGAHDPGFLLWLARGGGVGDLDVLLAATATGTGGDVPERSDLEDHPRVIHARRWREDVAVLGDERGLITLGRGPAGRCELSVEATSPGTGHGRELIAQARGLAPAGQPIFAAVSPGNVRSLRAFLNAGFAPIASEVLIQPGASQPLP